MTRTTSLALFPADKRMRPGHYGHVIVAHGDGTTTLEELHWGLRPRNGERPWGLIQSEGKSFDGLRCIAPLDEFYINGQHPNPGKWRVLPNGHNTAFAGIWRTPSPDWPASYAILTIEAGPDLAPYEPRQNVVLWEEDWKDWLHNLRPAEDVLKAPPAGSLRIDRKVKAAPVARAPKATANGDLPLFNF